MTNAEFQKELKNYKLYLKPELHEMLVMVGDAFSVEARVEIIDKFKEAEVGMKQLADYQQERIGIIRRGLSKINEYYESLKLKFKQVSDKDILENQKKADNLIANL